MERLRTDRDNEERNVRRKLERLREALAKGDADVAAGRVTTISSDEDLKEFFLRERVRAHESRR